MVKCNGTVPRSSDRDALLEAIESIHSIYTPYPRLDQIKRSIIDLIKRSNRQSQGDIHVLIGPTRSGKSHLLDDLMLDYQPERNSIQLANGDFCDRVPVVLAGVPKSNEKTVVEHIYASISGKDADQVLGSRYKTDKVIRKIVRLARECGLKLLILDEAHQSIDNKTDKVASDIAVLLKNLFNNKVFSILVVGTENAMRLIEANAETQSRTKVVYRLKPLGRSPEDRKIWAEVLGDIDDDLASHVFGRPTGITAPDMAEALLNAALGVVGHMADLLEQAAIMAVDEMIAGAEDPGIKWHHLEAAFAAWAPAVGRANPFKKAARPPADGTPPAADGDDGEDEEDLREGPASGVRGRKRANRRDADLRK